MNRPSRWRSLYLMLALFMGLSLALRLALWVKSGADVGSDGASAGQIIGLGLLYDAVTASAFFLPLVLFLLIWPASAHHRRVGRLILAMGYSLWVFLMLFVLVSEWIFWDEFGTRFNFIAVDYLLYTHEVIGNIRESYPVGWVLAALATAAAGFVWWQRDALLGPRRDQEGRLARFAPAVGLACCAAMGLGLLDASFKDQSRNRYVNALSGNGVFEFFAALRHNELDYAHFYPSLPEAEALQRLRRQLVTPHARLASDDPTDLTRLVAPDGPERRLNVVLISVESLSADFLGHFGNRERLTPRLDALARQGLLFTRLYATGTRTVRGLEALSLAVPPTPGQSIVKRPGNEGLFSLGSVFKAKGYDTRYVYGGYGYFDNMNAFFGANGYEVVDRTAIPSADVHHENIWGVADEDLFALALKQADASHARGRPAFMHIMTTSNHRPYTYPEGRIDIPSHTGRQGAVKYTDWAIGHFIDKASQRPWFRDTVFMIVADHCASSAGKTDLPVERYLIPAIVYAPAHIQPAQVSRLASQIDLAPTLLGLLNFHYESRFLGYDLFDLEPGRERAFISTYQDLGYLQGETLLRLDPRGGSQTSRVTGGHVDAGKAAAMPWEAVADAISWYQGAAWAYHHGGLLQEGKLTGAHASLVGRR